jgi:hypothetical protein
MALSSKEVTDLVAPRDESTKVSRNLPVNKFTPNQSINVRQVCSFHFILNDLFDLEVA